MTAAEIAALRALMAKAPITGLDIGVTNTDPHDGVFGEIAILAKDRRLAFGKACPFFALPYEQGRIPEGKEAARDNASLLVAALNALPALLSAAEDAARMRAALGEIIGIVNGLSWDRTLRSLGGNLEMIALAALAPTEEQARAAYLRDAI